MDARKAVLILQPFTPHISEELWLGLENKELCIDEKWPEEKTPTNKTNFNLATDKLEKRGI